MHVEWHSHLDGVNPRPPSVELRFAAALEFGIGNLLAVGCLHLVVEVGDDVGQLGLLVTTLERCQFDVRLSAALIVSVAGLHTISWRPLVEVGPSRGVVDVALLRVDGVECHESFVVDGARP